MHFLDLFWGAHKHHKIDPKSSRFCWNVTRCVSMFYSKSVKTELQDSVKCAKILKCQQKMSFQWGTNQTKKYEKITFWESMKNLDSFNALLENAWTWYVFFNFLFQHCVDGTPGFTRKCQNLGVPMRNIVWIRCKPNRDTSIFWDPWLIYFSPRKCLNMKGSMTSLFWGDSLDHVFFEVGF